jgi:hypothetical protein
MIFTIFWLICGIIASGQLYYGYYSISSSGYIGDSLFSIGIGIIGGPISIISAFLVGLKPGWKLPFTR